MKWKRIKLGDILQKIETINPQKTPDYIFEYVDISSVCNQRFLIEKTSAILGKDAPSRARRLIKANDILLATVRPTLKRIAQVPDYLDSQVCSTGFFVLRPKEELLDPRFLFHFLFTDSFMSEMEKLQKGASYPAVNDSDVNNQYIPLPPLEEQKRIVAILDETFTGIDQAIRNTEKNLASAREIFESYLNSIFTNRGGDWVEKKLGDVCEVKDGTHDSPKYVSEGIPFVTQKNIRHDGLNFDNIKFISREDHEKFYTRSNVRYGDIIISMIGANRGMSCIVDDKRVFSIKNVGLIKENVQINQSFLLYFLKSNQAQKYIESSSRGGAQPFIGLAKLREFPILISPLREQVKIVDFLDEAYNSTQRLESIYKRKIEALKELKQSILQKAFTGELTNHTVREVAA